MKFFRFIIITSLVLAFALTPLALWSAEEERGALLQLGFGGSFPSYPAATESLLSYVESQPGVDRVKVSVDIALGLAISQQSFLMAGIAGTGDRVFDSTDYVQLNLYLYSLGLRYFPLNTGPYLEAGGGAARGVAMASDGSTSTSDWGYGYGIAAGYDFDHSLRGFGLTLEARYLGLDIEGEWNSGLLITLNLCWK